MSGQARRLDDVGRRSGAGGPPGWIAVAGMLALVTVTAAFGGLAPADRPIEHVTTGTPYASDLLAVTVRSAVVADTVASEYIEPDPGYRVLVVTMDVTSLGPLAVGATNTTPGLTATLFTGSDPVVGPADLQTGDDVTAWYSDGVGRSPAFQPALPATVDVAWIVPADAVADGDVVSIAVRDFRIVTGQVIISEHSRRFTVGGTAALIAVSVTDLGDTA